jgi:hypothetical protein
MQRGKETEATVADGRAQPGEPVDTTPGGYVHAQAGDDPSSISRHLNGRHAGTAEMMAMCLAVRAGMLRGDGGAWQRAAA